MPKVKLSTGEELTIKDVWTHKIAKLFTLALYANAVDNKIQAGDLYTAYEAVLPEMVDSIKKGEATTNYSLDWLESLPEDDYKAIVTVVDSIGEVKTGKKNNG